MANATIRAPIRGTVLSRDVEIGSPVSSILNLGANAALVMTLGDVGRVFVRGKVDEADIGRVRLVSRRASASKRSRTRSSRPRHAISPMGVEKDNVTNFRGARVDRQPGKELKANMTAERGNRPRRARGRAMFRKADITYDAQKNAFVESRLARREERPEEDPREARRWQRDEGGDPRRPQAGRRGHPPVVMREAIIQSVQNLRATSCASFHSTITASLWGNDLGRRAVSDGEGVPARQRHGCASSAQEHRPLSGAAARGLQAAAGAPAARFL